MNQWTLLVGTLPIVFAISSASLDGLPISAIQREELFLTAAQSFFAVAIMSTSGCGCERQGTCSGCSGGSSFWERLVPESLHEVERIAVGLLYLVLGRSSSSETGGGCRSCSGTRS